MSKFKFPCQLLVVLSNKSLAILHDSSFKEVRKNLKRLKLNQETWVFFSRVMVNIVVIDQTQANIEHSNRCVDNYDSHRNPFCPFL